MIGNIIKFVFIVGLIIYVMTEIIRNPFDKCENPKCDICPFPYCNEEIENEWSDDDDN